MLPEEPTFDPDFLYQAQEGFYCYCTLNAAWECNVFDHLQTPVTAGTVARALSKGEAVVRKMLEALLVLGLVQKNGTSFTNTLMATTYCVSTSPLYQGHLFRHTDQTFGRPFLQQPQRLRSAAPEDDFDERLFVDGAEAGIGFALPKTLRHTREILEGLDCFRETCSFLDLGAGPGIYSLALVERHPEITATIFDMPPVIAHARKIAARYGLEDKVSFLEGDMLKGDPDGIYDIIFASDCVCMARRNLAEFLKGLRGKLTPGGAVVLKNTEVTRDAKSPKVNTLLEFGAELMGFGDYMFGPGEVASALRGAGFVKIQQIEQEHMTHHYVIQVAYR